MPQHSKNHEQPPNKKKGIFYFNISLQVIHSLIIVGISFLILGGALAAGIGAGYFAYLVEDTATPTKKELQKDLGDIAQTSKLAYADGSDIATISSDLLRTSVNSDQISDLLKKAIISTEDEYFYEHNGVVPKAVVRALLSEATGFGGGGGSTLTQQLVKQQVLTSETTFKRKANEILLSMEVEKFFSKEEIVTMYLNVSPFGRNNRGQNIAGVQEAAMGIFGKNATEVNLAQAAFIAGLPQSPIVYSPYDNQGNVRENLTAGLQRKDIVLFSMYRAHAISKKEYEEAKAYDLTKDFLPKQAVVNEERGFLYYSVLEEAKEVLVDKIAKEDGVSAKQLNNKKTYAQYLERAERELITGGYKVTSTIDKGIYDAMQASVTEYGYLLDNNQSDIEVGNVLMDNKTGRIYGFVGGRDFSKKQLNHAFDTARPAGSAIKPILVYGPAIDQGLMGSNTMISDYPAKWKAGDNAGEEIVNATDKGTKTFLSGRDALNVSSNIAAYNVYQDVQANTSANFVYENYLRKMNYPAQDDWAMESAPLGPMNVSTLQETNGYQTLANNGVYQKAYMIESITDGNGKEVYKHQEEPVQVYSPATATIMADMMRGVLQAGITTPFKGEISALNWYLGNADWVGKTGSSDHYKDSWLVVSTPSITLSSWSGNDDQAENDENAGLRTGKYLAYLANRVYMANPDIFGVDQKFELNGEVKGYDVSKYTGELPGKATILGVERTVPLESATSLWAKDGPKQSAYKFGIGGSDADYKAYWTGIYGSGNTSTKKKKTTTNNNSNTNNNYNYNTNTNNNTNTDTNNETNTDAATNTEGNDANAENTEQKQDDKE